MAMTAMFSIGFSSVQADAEHRALVAGLDDLGDQELEQVPVADQLAISLIAGDLVVAES